MPNKPLTGKFINCFGCNNSFYIPLYRFKTAKYCSRDCKDKYGCIERIIKNCEICKKEFNHISSRCNKAKYCSRKCYYKSLKGKGSKLFCCKNCSKNFMGSPSKNYSFCSKECKGKYERKPESYSSFSHLRKAYKIRGLIKKCEKCGYNECVDILGIHHIDRDRKNNKKENLMILCPTCHSLMHRKHISH